MQLKTVMEILARRCHMIKGGDSLVPELSNVDFFSPSITAHAVTVHHAG